MIEEVPEPTSEEQDSLPTDRESLKTRLRRQRQEQTENQWHDMDIPGYNGELFARYRLLDSDQLQSIGEKVRQETRNRSERILAAAIDTLVESCDEVWVRDNGREMPLREHEEYEGSKDLPIRIMDIDLADYLGFAGDLPDPPTARSVVLALFGGNTIALETHSALHSRWMMDADSEVDNLLGGF